MDCRPTPWVSLTPLRDRADIGPSSSRSAFDGRLDLELSPSTEPVTSRGAFLAAVALVLSMLVTCQGPATASPDAGSRPAGTPEWVPVTIDHPAPATTPLPAALMATSTVRGAVISPSQAAAVLSAVWSLRAQAFETDDRSLMAEFETGSALESDEVTCGCNTRAVRGPIYGESLLVPRQRKFPAAFLAEVETTLTNAPYVQYLVLARQSMATPWEVVSDPGESVTRTLDQPKIGQGGFDDGATPSAAAAKNLPSDLASYWHTWTEEDHAPTHSPFAPGKWTTQAGATYAKDPSGSWSSQNDLLGYYNFQSGDDNEVWSFGTASGTITCGVVRWQTIWTYPAGGIYQDPAQNNWGPSVAPGNYQYEAETQIMQPCFIQRPGTGVAVVSGLGDPDTEQGVNPLPATPAPPSTPTSPSTPVPVPQISQA
jgi:hypothetical protein